MKKNKLGVPLDEVFAGSEKDPRWAEAYAKADIEVRLAIQIAKARAKAHMTQGQLAKAVGTTQSVISRIERGNQNLTVNTLSRIAAVLHTTLVIQLRHSPPRPLGRRRVPLVRLSGRAERGPACLRRRRTRLARSARLRQRRRGLNDRPSAPALGPAP